MDLNKETVLKVTWVGMVGNVGLAIMKMICGIVAHSSALIADGLHSFSDLVSDVVVLVGAHYWCLPADANHAHGHQKIEVFSSLIIGVILFFVGVGIVYDCFGTILQPHVEHETPTMAAYVATIIAIVCKELLYLYTAHAGKKIKSSALIANAWHHRSDALSSIPVFISLVIMYFVPGLWQADVVGSIIVSCFIFYAAWKIIKDAAWNLADSSAPHETVAEIKKVIMSCEDVRGFHNMRTRLIGSSTYAIDFHLEVDPEMPVHIANTLAHEVSRQIKEKIEDVVDVIIHVDPYRIDRVRKPGDCE